MNPAWSTFPAEQPNLLQPLDLQDHRLIYRGGRILPDLQYVLFFLGGQDEWDAEEIQQIDRHLYGAMTDPQLDRVVRQYFENRPITTTRWDPKILPGPRPITVSQQDIHRRLVSMYQSGQLNTYRGRFDQMVFVFVLPYGTVLQMEEAVSVQSPIMEEAGSSLTGLGGFHGSVHPEPGVTLYYAVTVYPDLFESGRFNGIRGFDEPWKTIVAILYHELQEVRTDPDVEDVIRAGFGSEHKLGWVSAQGEEVGDYPVFQAGGNIRLVMREFSTEAGLSVPIQMLYSNATGGPSGPLLFLTDSTSG